MAYFAELDANNIVTQVLAVSNDTIDNLPFPESESVGIEFCRSLFGADTNWAQTSYNKNFRHNYAAIGFTFDSTANAFIPTKPFPSWLLNTDTYLWTAPVPYPKDGKMYSWDETTQSWVEIE